MNAENEYPDHDNQRKQLANLVAKGAKLGDCGRMCHTCAFKLDSEANLEPHNVDAAWNAVAWGGTFNCHIETGVDKGEVCVGFKYAKQFFDSLD